MEFSWSAFLGLLDMGANYRLRRSDPALIPGGQRRRTFLHLTGRYLELERCDSGSELLLVVAELLGQLGQIDFASAFANIRRLRFE